jgi:hypothetical protein
LKKQQATIVKAFPLEHISKVRILLIRQILKSMDIALVISLSHTRGRSSIALRIQALQVESQEDDDQKQEDVAAHVGAESNKVAGSISAAEDLWAWRFNVSGMSCVNGWTEGCG